MKKAESYEKFGNRHRCICGSIPRFYIDYGNGGVLECPRCGFTTPPCPNMRSTKDSWVTILRLAVNHQKNIKAIKPKDNFELDDAYLIPGFDSNIMRSEPVQLVHIF